MPNNYLYNKSLINTNAKNLRLLSIGTNSRVYSIANTEYVLKKYINPIVAKKEIDFLESMIQYGFKHIITPVVMNIEYCAIVMRLMSPLSILPFNLLEPIHKIGIVKSILNGIHELHSHNIVHNDIKPDNILYDPITLSIKIIDFSSSFIEGIDEANNCTTPYYSSPDIIKSKQSDIWSFGMLLFKLMEIKIDDTKNIKIPLKSNNNRCNDFLLYIARLCLKINPQKRPSALSILKTIDRKFSF